MRMDDANVIVQSIRMLSVYVCTKLWLCAKAQ